jgi:hypothetical protein
MRIHDDLLNSVIYLYPDSDMATRGERRGGP